MTPEPIHTPMTRLLARIVAAEEEGDHEEAHRLTWLAIDSEMLRDMSSAYLERWESVSVDHDLRRSDDRERAGSMAGEIA